MKALVLFVAVLVLALSLVLALNCVVDPQPCIPEFRTHEICNCSQVPSAIAVFTTSDSIQSQYEDSLQNLLQGLRADTSTCNDILKRNAYADSLFRYCHGNAFATAALNSSDSLVLQSYYEASARKEEIKKRFYDIDENLRRSEIYRSFRADDIKKFIATAESICTN